MNTHTLHGRVFEVAADFPDTDAGIKAANDFMMSNPNTGLLDIADGRCIISRCDDRGIDAIEWTDREAAELMRQFFPLQA